MDKKIIKKVSAGDYFSFFNGELRDSVIIENSYNHFYITPEQDFLERITVFAREKVKIEKLDNEERLIELGGDFVITGLRSLTLDKESYSTLLLMEPKSKLHYIYNKEAYGCFSLTAYYLLKVFNSKNTYKNMSPTAPIQCASFADVRKELNEHMRIANEIAKIEKININNVFKFICDKNFENHIENLILTDMFWNFIKERNNELYLLKVWDRIAAFPIKNITHLNRAIEKEKDSVINWANNIPIELLKTNIKFKGFKEDFKSLSERTDFDVLFPILKEVVDIKEREIREGNLLSKLEDNEVERKKRKI